jgi:hypothetical protein
MIADEQYIFKPEAKKKLFHFVGGWNTPFCDWSFYGNE